MLPISPPMAEEGTSPKSKPNLMVPSACNECRLNPWKYRCPGCSIRSCSLPCVNSHKKRSGCTGKRNRTQFVPLSQFEDDLLLSDYSLLEETKRVVDSARKMISGFRGWFGFKLPVKLKMLRTAAYRRRIQLLFFQPGMSKRQSNRSKYDQRKKSIFWTIELRFHRTDVVLVLHGVDEQTSLLCILGKHLAPGPWNHKLRPFCDVQLDDLKLFLKKNPKISKSPFRKLDIKEPIGCQLANTVVLEYPVILVYLPSHDHDFEVETGKMPFTRNIVPSSSDGISSHSGTLYRVEEIEEGDKPTDTIVTDLKECRKSAVNCPKVSEDANVASNVFIAEDIPKVDDTFHFTDMQPGASSGGFRYPCGEKHRALVPNSPESPEEAGFYFEQELTDAYSDIIGEINPDDFLCLDGGFNDGDDFTEARWYDTEERKMVDSVERNDGGLDEVAGAAFEIRKGDRSGESKENDLKEKPVSDLEAMQINESEERTGGLEERRENFLSGGHPLAELELEEGEIPCYL